jgi:cytoskeletal protein RodZ
VDTESRPVLAGLVALVAVAVVVGLVGGFAALVGTQALGIDGDAIEVADTEPTATGTMYLPEPSETSSPTGPQFTLVPGEESSDPAATSSSEPESPTEEAKPRKAISLSAAQLTVSAMQQIDLTGTYVGGEGAILQVQRLESGVWTDFPVTASVSDETFSTYVQTSQPGVNKFRVIDTDTLRVSNPVNVTVG